MLPMLCVLGSSLQVIITLYLAAIVIERMRELHRGHNVAIFMLYCNCNDPETQSIQPLVGLS